MGGLGWERNVGIDSNGAGKKTGRAQMRENAAASLVSTASREGARPVSDRMEVTPRWRMPQGWMRSKWLRSGSTLSANPWKATQRRTATPIAATFCSPTQTPV